MSAGQGAEAGPLGLGRLVPPSGKGLAEGGVPDAGLCGCPVADPVVACPQDLAGQG